MRIGLQIADFFLTIFHTSWMLFNLLGWIFPSTQRFNLLTLLLTISSWTLLGYWYGWGYCPLTDLHFSILEQLGHTRLPPSYLQFLLARFVGLSISTQLADMITVGGLALAASGSLAVNLWKWMGTEKVNQK